MEIGSNVTDARMGVLKRIFAYAGKDKVKAKLQVRQNEF